MSKGTDQVGFAQRLGQRPGILHATPSPLGPCTYIGAGGLVEVKVQPGAPLEQLRLARRFLDILLEPDGKP